MAKSAWEKFKESLGFGGGDDTNKIDTDTAVSDVINEGGTRTYTAGIGDDFTMGLSTIGLTGEKQAEKLAELGYSPGAIEDFQSRTAENKVDPMTLGGSDDDDNRRTVTEEPETEVTEDVEETDGVSDMTTQIQEVADIATGRRGGSAGPAEDEARAFAEKGRKSTVLTSMQGLEDLSVEDLQKLRSRRSLLAG